MALKVYLNKDDTATFNCPECDRSRIADVSKYIRAATAIKINCKCKCGHEYSVSLERRRNFRKVTDLPGRYITEDNDRGFITVTDVSYVGIGFKMNTPPQFSTGEKIMVEFKLDDQRRSLIKREVNIVSMRGLQVGAKFCTVDHYDGLGSYVMP
jgi:hypothetical protein